MKPTRDRIDWKIERERIDLVAVASSLLGPAPGRRGEGGRKLWWRCPFHSDLNPSLSIEPGKPWWKCFGCGESGDAANLVMRLEGKSFPEAVAQLTSGGPGQVWKASSKPARRLAAKPLPEPSGLPEADALALVAESAACLWTSDRAEALAHLTNSRALSVETIRAAHLGWTSGVSIPTREGDRYCHAHGFVVPWFVDHRLALVKIRQTDDRRPKYIEAFRHPARLVCYPGPELIQTGRPLVVVEGEFDALALGEVLKDLATVLTLGSASTEPTPAVLNRFLSTAPWYVATDADQAGDKAAMKWPKHSKRVRPPAPYKDWTEARTAGINLRRWWSDILAGIAKPPLFSWDELAQQRWGPSTDGGG